MSTPDPAHLEIVRAWIRAIGDDPEREGLKGTPERVVKSWGELFSGYGQEPKEFCAVFGEAHDQMVVCRGIEFTSFCEHHLLPFVGSISIGYIPAVERGVLGLSKLARISDVYARRLQIQERLTNEIANAIVELIAPRGVAVVVRARHSCMSMRGIGKQNSEMVTSEMRGIFRDDPSARGEMLAILTGSR